MRKEKSMEFKPLCIGDLTAKIPLIQGGMGVGVSLSNLAGNVALQGGIGIISTAQIGYREEDFSKNPLNANLRAIGKELEKAREIAKGGIVGFNIMVATRNYGEYVKEVCRQGADLIISGAGLPVDLPKLAEGFQTKLAPIVSSVKATSVICKMWDRKYNVTPDMIVVEGPLAGGHLGFSLEDILSYTKEKFENEIKGIILEVEKYAKKYGKKIPVVVAGGISNEEDVNHYLNLGAQGVQVATQFVTTEECDASIEYKNTYINAKKEDITIVKSPVGMPGRAIANKFLDQVRQGNKQNITKCYQCLSKCNPLEIPYCITDALIKAVRGDVDNGLLFCGANAYKAERIETVSDVFKRLGFIKK